MRIDWRFEGGRGAGDAGSGQRRRWLTQAGEMLEVEGDSDMRGRLVGERREREKGKWAGGGLDGPLARVEKKEGLASGPARLCGLRRGERWGWAAR
jgi:hypothetical protein